MLTTMNVELFFRLIYLSYQRYINNLLRHVAFLFNDYNFSISTNSIAIIIADLEKEK